MFNLLKYVFSPHQWVELFTFYGGGGKGGKSSGSTSSTNTTYSTNIPEYAKPYVQTMLGTAQQQIFDVNDQGQVTNFKPFNPYSQNAQDYVAPMSPLQMQSFYGAGELQQPGQFDTATGMATNAGQSSMNMAGQAGMSGQDYYNMATNPGSIQQFMNPYIQASLQPQLAEAERQYGISGTQQQSNATRSGAFGGSREALMASENQRNKNSAMNQIIGSGYDKAFQAAQQAQQFGAGLRLQGQQAAMTGYGQAGQAAGLLGNLGTSQLAAQQGILGTQNTMGTQMQQQQQNIINQAIQNYANEQQYPMQQLGNMSNLLRGLPMQSSSTAMYQAPPSTMSQIGALGAGAYGMSKLAKKGGLPKHFEKEKKGGSGIDSLSMHELLSYKE